MKLVPTGYYGNGAEGEVQVQRKGFSTAIAYGSNSDSDSDTDTDTSSTNQNDAASASEEYIHHLLLASSPDVHQQVIDVDGIDMLVYGKELDLPQAVSVLQTPSSSSNHTHTQHQHQSQHQSQNNREHAAAATAAAVQVFDKILILVGHGEAQFVTEEQSKTSFGNKKEGDFCLSSHVSS